MCQEKEKEENFLILKIIWMYQYEDYIKKSKERLTTVASNSSDNIRTNRTTTKTKKHMGRKTTVWIFQATNSRNFTWEDLDMAMIGKP